MLITDEKEKDITETLKKNNYPKKFVTKINTNIEHGGKQTAKTWTSTVVIPYRPETSDDIRRILNNQNIRVFFKISDTLKSNLVHIKDKIPKESQSNCVYKIKCLECDAIYIGQTSREIKIRRNEHRRASIRPRRNPVELEKLGKLSAIGLHAIESGHKIDFDNIEIIQKNFRNHKERLISETLHIKWNPNCLNRNDGLKQNLTWFQHRPYKTS